MKNEYRSGTRNSILIMLLFFIVQFAISQTVQYKIDEKGNLKCLFIKGDNTNMNWILKTDGSQYNWITTNYGWGLGYFTENHDRQSIKREWKIPVKMSDDSMDVTYCEGNIQISVNRRNVFNDLHETYTFTNLGQFTTSLSDIGIYTPFNDNYPDAITCVNNRTNVHIWEGGNAAYVNAIRMGGFGPHIGLVVTEGSVKSYEIWERGRLKENSQFRGVISLNLPNKTLKKGESYSISWCVFSHNGNEDFLTKMLDRGGVLATANKYIFEVGEKAHIEFRTKNVIPNCRVRLNGVPVSAKQNAGCWTVESVVKQAGELRFDFYYGMGKTTHVNCLVINNISDLIQKRINFIINHQQMKDTNDMRFGAFMVYDNEVDQIYLNNTPNANPPDRDEGEERTGMGVLLAKQYLLTHDKAIKKSLMQYATFMHEKLQDNDFAVYGMVNHKGRVRGYNFVWMAEFYFYMYKVTVDKKFATYGYETLQAMYRKFGYGFYAIEIPVKLGLEVLQKAGLKTEYEDLKNDFVKTGDIFVDNGLNYPKHEVNYEQSIVAPSITFLTQLYLATKAPKYLDAVKQQLPALEAFNGFQPSYHKNDISIRHWDGYWFGKQEMFGDVFPHYWSTQTGSAFYYYFLCSGDKNYLKRAENIVRNNLCLFSEDGKASCAYMYPYKINGVKAEFYDPYANDQDWALVSYLLVNKHL